MKSADESKRDRPPAEAPGPKMPAEELMRLAVHPAELGSSGNCRMQVFPGGDNLTAQRHFLRFRCGGPGL
jgi:hypothetical protein